VGDDKGREEERRSSGTGSRIGLRTLETPVEERAVEDRAPTLEAVEERAVTGTPSL